MPGPAAYLQPADYSTFGCPTATDAQVLQASRLVDGYLGRAKYGCVWVPDADNFPCYMAAASADMTWTSKAAIAPGENVVVQVTGAPVFPEIIGRTVTIDVANSETTEACVITSVNMPSVNSITLGRVRFAHTAPVSLQGGLQIFEERYLPQDRSLARVSQWPIAMVRSGLGRYSYGRRSQQMTGNFSDFNLLAILQQFGGPPAWVPMDVLQLGVNPTSGELWIPAGVLLSYYSETRLWYLAGWSQADLPIPIKQATASIALALATSTISTQLRKYVVGPLQSERFSASNIDDDTKRLLNPFKARTYV